MADGTEISWADATLNVINGCSLVSPGCTNCYAMKQAHRFDVRRGLTQQTKGGMVWTGEVRFNEKVLLEPLRWKRPRKIFWNAHGDTFHEKVPDDWIDRCFAIMALTPHHIHQVLTKRPERMREYIAELQRRPRYAPVPDGKVMSPYEGGYPTNVWLGTSVEDQTRADERIPILLDTPAAVRWLSCEPLLGPVDLRPFLSIWHGFPDHIDRDGYGHGGSRSNAIDWVVAGGESGPGARPMHPDWARSLRDQCAAAGVPLHFKQWGNWAPIDALRLDGARAAGDGPISDSRGHVRDWMNRYVTFEGDAGAIRVRGHTFTGHGTNLVYNVGKKRAGRLLDGVEHNGWPPVIMLRQSGDQIAEIFQ